MSQPLPIERPALTPVARITPEQPRETPRETPKPPSDAKAGPADEAAMPFGADLPSIAGRDFASTLDLIREASEAVRLSEERANELEDELARTTARNADQVQALEAQVATTERRLLKAEERARAAETRAVNAETWLIRIHDAVASSFKRSSTTTSTS